MNWSTWLQDVVNDLLDFMRRMTNAIERIADAVEEEFRP